MATPTGQIAFSDLNTELLRAGSTAQLNMNSAGQRLGYGGSSQVSISELKKSFGATVTCGTYTDKFGTTTGFAPGIGPPPGIGSMDSATYTPGYSFSYLATGFGLNSLQSSPSAPGFAFDTINRFALDNSTRGISIPGYPASADVLPFDGPAMPGSGTITMGVRWA